MSRLFTSPDPQFIDGDGEPLTSGKIYFYEAASGETLKPVYSDYLLTAQLTNPVILEVNGKLQTSIFLNGDYKWKITNSADVTIKTGNNYDPPELGSQFGDWDATITYAVEDFVRGSDGNYYQSLSSGNVGNNPTSSAVYWVQKYFQDVWNANKAYAVDDIVYYGGDQWVSLQSSNTGNEPSTSSTYWRSFFVPADANNYIAASFEYRVFDGGILSGFDAFANILITDHESIGPTGSGAENIWSSMDVIPDNATMAIVKIKMRAQRDTSDGIVSLYAEARSTGSTSDTIDDAVIFTRDTGGASATIDVVGLNEFTIPLDDNNRFDLFWDITGDNTGTNEVDLYLMGYKT